MKCLRFSLALALAGSLAGCVTPAGDIDKPATFGAIISSIACASIVSGTLKDDTKEPLEKAALIVTNCGALFGFVKEPE